MTVAEKRKILVVDDEQLLIQGLVRTLRSENAEIITAETGEEAIRKILSHSFHLCFLDIYLPDMSGMEILGKLKEISPQTKVVIMTAGTINQKMEETIEKNAYLYLPKPFDLLQVKMLAKRLLE